MNLSGFTIVELLIVIVVIGILAAIVIVAYNGIQQQATTAKRSSDMKSLLNAVQLARNNKDQTLGEITGNYYSLGRCIGATYNPSGTEPRDLPKSHECWVRYYDNLDRLGAAAGMNFSSLKSGDSRGNPYMFDENEGEGGDYCRTDGVIRYFTGDGIAYANGLSIPKYRPEC